MTTRTLFIGDIVGRVIDEMTALGIKQDLSSDPAAPSPGMSYRLYGEGLTPTHNAQGDESQVVFTAALKIVLGEGQSGGNRAQTSINLLSACEQVADMLNYMNTNSDIEVRWTDGANAINDANLAKNVVAFEIDYDDMLRRMMLTADVMPETEAGALLWGMTQAPVASVTPEPTAADVEAEIISLRDTVHAACGVERNK